MVFSVIWLVFSCITIFLGIRYGHQILDGLPGVVIGGACGAAVGYLVGWVLPLFLMSRIRGRSEPPGSPEDDGREQG